MREFCSSKVRPSIPLSFSINFGESDTEGVKGKEQGNDFAMIYHTGINKKKSDTINITAAGILNE